MKDTPSDAFETRFGLIATHLLDGAPLAGIWRLAFVANAYTGPIYAWLQAEHGLTRPGFVTLYCLSQRSGLMARDVVRASGLPKNSVSRAVTDLIDRGLIAVTDDREDRRVKRLALTRSGTALLREVLPAFQTRQDALLAPLTAAESARLRQLLSRLAGGLPGWIDETGGS
ncbi:MAG: MarR family transcriptional regulator [Pseudomonadota bacterium]